MIIFMVALVLALHGTETLSSVDHGPLAVDYYKESCPLVEDIVRRSVQTAVFKDPRMAASLLRLHFHDCFVMVSPLSLSLSVCVCVCQDSFSYNWSFMHGFRGAMVRFFWTVRGAW